MNASDAVLLIPTGIGLIAAFAFYAFAHSINRRRAAAAREEASAPFEQAQLAANAPSLRERMFPATSMSELAMTLRRATNTGRAVMLTKKSTAFSVRRKKAAREKA